MNSWPFGVIVRSQINCLSAIDETFTLKRFKDNRDTILLITITTQRLNPFNKIINITLKNRKKQNLFS